MFMIWRTFDFSDYIFFEFETLLLVALCLLFSKHVLTSLVF